MRATTGCATPFTVKITVPVGVPVATEATVAVNVTGCPYTGEVTLLDTVVVVLAAKFAVTQSAAVIVTWHVGVEPEHGPDQPAKDEVAAGVAVKVTMVAFGYDATQVVPQWMAPDPSVTVPVPGPAGTTVSCRCSSVNVAVTDVAWVKPTTQAPVPLQAPDHPLKVDEPASAIGINETILPYGKLVEQVPGHEMPAGLLVIVPEPEPDEATVSCTGSRVKVAVTTMAWFTVNVQVVASVPGQAPDHPANEEVVVFGLAVNVTCVPDWTFASQVPGHAIPTALLVTVPLPLPPTPTWRLQFGILLKIAPTVSD